MPIPTRPFGKTGLETSILGFGCMRLPVLGGDQSAIDIPAATAMIRTAIDAGVNYVDTAYPYHSANFPYAGESEPLVAHALADGWRDKVILATKLPLWIVESRSDMDRLLDEQLARLKTDHIDVYLAHNCNRNSWPTMRDLGLLDFLDAATRDGRIKHAGFSFHDGYDLFEEIMDSYDWPVAQVQYNYLDAAYEAYERCMRLPPERGAGLVIMEPLRGGFLANKVPEHLRAMLREIRPDWSLAEWALRWLWNKPELSVVLSGMSTPEQVEENLRIAASVGEPGTSFGPDEEEALLRVRTWFVEHLPVNCTACGYCMPCPAGVAIPNVFGFYNEYALDDETLKGRAERLYHMTLPESARAGACTACGVCETRCPQGIAIPDRMVEVNALFG